MPQITGGGVSKPKKKKPVTKQQYVTETYTTKAAAKAKSKIKDVSTKDYGEKTGYNYTDATRVLPGDKSKGPGFGKDGMTVTKVFKKGGGGKTHYEMFQDELQAKKKRVGGTAHDVGGGGTIGDGGRVRPGGGGKTTLGLPSGGGISSGFRDRDLVGSGNTIEEFDGSSYSSSVETEIVGGGGGGTGSALFGREAVGRVGDTEGKSLDEVVYGVQKRGKKVRKPRSL